MGSGSRAIKAISFLKTAVQTCKGTTAGFLDIATPMKAFLCYEMIQTCLEPKLNACRDTCYQFPLYYAPNLTVTSSWFNRDAPGIFYDEENKKLRVSVLNNGVAYAWDIDVNVTYGTTKNQNRLVSGGGTLLSQKLVGLTFWGAAQAGHKTVGESIKDFLINESNFTSYLAGFKSDKDYPIIPSFWETEIPFEAKDGEFTKVTINVDQNNSIPETNERDNTYTLEINKLPNPAEYTIENIKAGQTGNNLGDYILSFDLKNTGAESGKATITLTEGNITQVGKVTFFQNLSAGETKRVTNPLHFDVSKANDTCALVKQIDITVTDEKNRTIRESYSFPIHSGRVSGHITDLFGKPIKGATIKASSGQIATSGDNGYYHIMGIDKLGTLSIIASHPNFSETQSKEVVISMTEVPAAVGLLFSCDTTGLIYESDFILKNTPVKWTIFLKDSLGQMINGSMLVTNDSFRRKLTIKGEKIIDDFQPGEYNTTVSSPGYYSKFQRISLNPPNVTTEVILEKIEGRVDDSGLRLITPKLLWKKNLGSGGGIIGELTATKNGKLLVIYNANNKTKTASLFFINPLTGKQIKEVLVPYTISEQRNIGLDSSYDGRTVGLFINPGAPGSTNKERILNLFDASGRNFGTTTMDRHNSIFLDVSPDGFYVFPNALLNSSLHKYTRKEVEGIGDGRDLQGYGSFAYFLRSGNLISGCNDRESGWCELSIVDQKIRKIVDLEEMPLVMDQTIDNILIIRTDKKLYYFGNSSWEKEVKRYHRFVSASVSPGGMYSMVASGNGSDRTLKIFGNTGGDKTPIFDYKNVRFVSANDKGLFFASVVSDSISYYQIGAYQKDYNAPASKISDTKNTNFITGFFSSMGNFFNKLGSLFMKNTP